jgi:hypothetical protein
MNYNIAMEEEIKKEFIVLKLSEIIPYKSNPRIISEIAIKKVIDSIELNGYLDPIEIDENNIILSGHTRFEALKRIGVDKADCIRHNGMDSIQKQSYRIAANKTAEYSEWDEDKLSNELFELEEKMKDLSDCDMYKFTGIDRKDSLLKDTNEEIIHPYKKSHILISFDIDKSTIVKESIEKLYSIDGVEIEKSSN